MKAWLEELKQIWSLDIAMSPTNENKFFLSLGWFNALVEVDIETLNTKIISEFPCEEDIIHLLHGEILCINNKIYFCPLNAEGMYIYDVTHGSMKYVLLPVNEVCGHKKEEKFERMFCRGKYIYLLPVNYNQILKFDIQSEEFYVIDAWYDEFRNIIDYKEEEYKERPYFSWNMIYKDVCIWQIVNTDYVMIFDIKTEKVTFDLWRRKKIVSIEKGKVSPHIICEDGSCWYYDVEKKDFLFLYMLKFDVKKISFGFIRIEDIYYIPLRIENKMMIYDCQKQTHICVPFETDATKIENTLAWTAQYMFIWIKQVNNQIWLFNKYNELIQYDIDTAEYVVKKVVLDTPLYLEEKWLKKNKDEFKKKYIGFPFNSHNIHMLLCLLKTTELEDKQINIGKRIFKNIVYSSSISNYEEEDL